METVQFWESRAQEFAADGSGLRAVCSYAMPNFYNRAIDITQKAALAELLESIPQGAQVLGDVPAVSEGVLDLGVAVAPEHVTQRLDHLGAGGGRAGERRVGVVDLQGQHGGRASDRGRCQHAHLGELVGQVQLAVADAGAYFQEFAFG